MSFPEFSVIIPVYNSARMLERCVDSVLCQSYRNFELLLINDGSTDSSGVICDDYIQKDNRIKVIHQTNGGPSKARNKGLASARGTWICFIDSDDWVEPDYIHGFVSQHNLDQSVLIIQNFNDTYLDDNGKVAAKKHHRFYNKGEVSIQNVKELIVDYYLLKDGYPFCKLYNAQVIKENRLQFDQKMKFSEDTVFLLNYLSYVKKLHFVNFCFYNHVISKHSLSNKYYSYDCEIWAYRRILQSLGFLKHHNYESIS